MIKQFQFCGIRFPNTHCCLFIYLFIYFYLIDNMQSFGVFLMGDLPGDKFLPCSWKTGMCYDYRGKLINWKQVQGNTEVLRYIIRWWNALLEVFSQSEWTFQRALWKSTQLVRCILYGNVSLLGRITCTPMVWSSEAHPLIWMIRSHPRASINLFDCTSSSYFPLLCGIP